MGKLKGSGFLVGKEGTHRARGGGNGSASCSSPSLQTGSLARPRCRRLRHLQAQTTKPSVTPVTVHHLSCLSWEEALSPEHKSPVTCRLEPNGFSTRKRVRVVINGCDHLTSQTWLVGLNTPSVSLFQENAVFSSVPS